MARYTFKMQRLYLDHPLFQGAEIALDKAQVNYLLTVLRMGQGDALLAFNGRDGEWRAVLSDVGKKTARLAMVDAVRPQPAPMLLDYCFAPLKHARLDYMVQKAVEMGAARLRPVITTHTQTARLNLDRMRANVIEASEQCGILSIADVLEPVKLTDLLLGWQDTDPGRMMIFCDEGDLNDDPLTILRTRNPALMAVLIGPEGGFSEEERALLRSYHYVLPLPLGPRIMRADTAAVAALALVQATLGDWRAAPSEKGS